MVDIPVEYEQKVIVWLALLVEFSAPHITHFGVRCPTAPTSSLMVAFNDGLERPEKSVDQPLVVSYCHSSIDLRGNLGINTDDQYSPVIIQCTFEHRVKCFKVLGHHREVTW